MAVTPRPPWQTQSSSGVPLETQKFQGYTEARPQAQDQNKAPRLLVVGFKHPHLLENN